MKIFNHTEIKTSISHILELLDIAEGFTSPLRKKIGVLLHLYVEKNHVFSTDTINREQLKEFIEEHIYCDYMDEVKDIEVNLHENGLDGNIRFSENILNKTEIVSITFSIIPTERLMDGQIIN